jgi:hypothetical protein
VGKAVDILIPEISSADVLAMAKISQNQLILPPALGSGIMDLLPTLKVAPTANNAELFSICKA